MKICPVGGGRTDMMKQIVTLRNFVNASKKVLQNVVNLEE